jgi:HSP90 family molecular chaperone
MTELFQFFENSNKALLMQEMNEFSANILDPEIFEIIEIRLQEPNWDRAFIHYRSKVSREELQKKALAELEKERLKNEAIQKKQYSDEELKAFAEINRVSPEILSSKEEEVPADKLKQKSIASMTKEERTEAALRGIPENPCVIVHEQNRVE